MDPDSGARRLEATVREDSRPPVVGAASGFAEGAQVAGRFVVNRALGRGSSGEVLAVQDLALDREVAMKVLRGAGGPAIARFMREARITARLDHPGIPPVHALEFLPDGGLLFTMRKLEGMTLGDAIRRAAVGEAPPAIASVNAVVNLGLRVCEALSRAHFLGIVHCDVKPDNIMLGQHGEVALVDWGECRLADEPPAQGGSTVGTPAYMSPEQARGEAPDRRSDLYSLGATLFHALSSRLPTFDDAPERFWEKKRRGEIDPLPEEVRARIPRPLFAIVQRVLSADPAARYATAAELAADLERFQAGQAVAAYRDSIVEYMGRWLRRHRRDVLAAGLIAAVCLVTGGLLWRERQRQLADWGSPVVVEDFSSEGWQQRWKVIEGAAWRWADGAIETTGAEGNRLRFERLLGGAVAIEYTAETPAGGRAGDLSVFWDEDPGLGGRQENRGYIIQAGAFDNQHCQLARQPGFKLLDRKPLRLAVGVRHRFRVELDGTSIAMWVDGEQVLQADELLPIGMGRIGLLAYYQGQRFDDIRIYQKRLPEVVPILAQGDVLLHRRSYAEAAGVYRQIMESHPGTELAADARFRLGLAARLDGDRRTMESAWAGLPAGELADHARAYGIEDRLERGEDAEAADDMVELWNRRPRLRGLLRTIMVNWLERLRASDLDPDAMRRVEIALRLKLERLPPDACSDPASADLLLAIGRSDAVLAHHPEEAVACTVALIRRGRSGEVLRRYPGSALACYRVLREQGLFAEILADSRMSVWMRTVTLCLAGRIEEALRAEPGASFALRQVGRFEDALQRAGTKDEQAISLAALGRFTEAAALGSGSKAAILQLAGQVDPRRGGTLGRPGHIGWRLVKLDDMGDAELCGALRASLRACWPDWTNWIAYGLIDPLLAKDADLLRCRLDELWAAGRNVAHQRAWHLAGYALGHLDETALRGQPCAVEVEMWLAVGRALRHSLAGESGPERAAWNDYRNLPWQQRAIGGMLPDPGLEALAQRLAGGAP